jgi:hypothetical protein
VLILFAPFAVAAWVRPPEVDYGHDKVLHLFTLTLLTAASAALIRGREGLKPFAVSWAVAGLVLGFVTLQGAQFAGRATGFGDEAGSSPIWLARAMSSALLCLVWLRLRHRTSWALVLPAVAVLCYAIVETGSRGPLLGAAAGAVILVWSYRRGHASRWLLLLVAGLVALFVATYTSLLRGQRIFGTDPTGLAAESSEIRRVLWSHTLQLIAAEPNGVGFGAWGYATGIAPSYYWPHNIFLEVFAEEGWAVGVVFTVTVLVILLRSLRAARRSLDASLMAALLLCETLAVSLSGDLNARTFFALLVLAAVVPKWVRAGSSPPNVERPSARSLPSPAR